MGGVRRFLWQGFEPFATAPDIHAQAGLGAWWNKMLKTKAVAALKGKGKKLMPGEHNKAW